MNNQSPMPTVLGDPLPGFVPELWLQAQAETQWAAQQVQGFTVQEPATGDAILYVRDCLRPEGEQTLWQERLVAADLPRLGTAEAAQEQYRAAHARMMQFLALQAVVLCAARYRVLRSEFVAKGVV